ncbi:MAG: helix-turn-helix domain-containing protein [Bacteroidetes bacterium]|nr:helix-turn-helix domain-containing protein [Bacteroidota bacterium]
MKPDQIFSSKEVADMLGVNESSVKRWTDSGKIKCIRTPGGHRKFRLEDVNDFLRVNNLGSVPFSDQLFQRRDDDNLPVAIRYRDYGILIPHFYRLALLADSNEIFNFLTILGMHDYPLADLFDYLLSPVLVRIGTDWEMGKVSVDEEHAATAAIFDSLIRLQFSSTRLPRNPHHALIAVLENDFHEIPAKCMGILLDREGWNIHYLGANSPIFSIENAIRRQPPSVLILGSTIAPDQNSPIPEAVEKIGRSLKNTGGHLIVGGSGLNSFRDTIPSVDWWAGSFRETLQFIRTRFSAN